jgi:hypothetical protein
VAARSKSKPKMVTLVTTEILRPYRANEIFQVPEDIARKLLNVNMQDEFGQVFYPKVRLYNQAGDEHLQLVNGTLNDEEKQKLLFRLHPELADEEDYEEDVETIATPKGEEPTTEFEKVLTASDDKVDSTEKRGRGRPRKN